MSYKHSLSALFCITALIFIAPPALATELNVPAQYATIQAAINAAATAGDTIIVQPGTYNEDISFGGKDIILTSTDPDTWSTVEATIIQGTGTDSVVKFSGPETPACQLNGFTITGGNSPTDGGGISGADSDPTFYKCIIEDNHADDNGGGVSRCYYSDFISCIIRNNTCGENGGAFYLCHDIISDCEIYSNSAGYDGGALASCGADLIDCIIHSNTAGHNAGALIYCHDSLFNCLIIDNSAANDVSALDSCNADITNCTIANNTSDSGGVLNSCNGVITNCIIWNNSNNNISNSSTPTYSCWPFGSSGTGNISSDPCFVTGPGGDYCLSQVAAGQAADSPCVDTGSETAVYLDLDNKTTRTDQINDSGTADMGFHYALILPDSPLISSSPTSLTFTAEIDGSNPQDQTIDISNVGAGTLNWTLSESCSWLTVDPCSGTSTGQADTVTVSADITGLTVGDYECDLTISDLGAANSPQIVTVHLTLNYPTLLYVPSQYTTIQSAINAAINGNTIIVAPGIYNENINFGGKDIILTSTDPYNKTTVETTIIQGTGSGCVVSFSGTETTACQFTGFTITGGDNSGGGGGGIFGNHSLATISNCNIDDNVARYGGGLYGCDGTIQSCSIYNNTATYHGGGLAYCDGEIMNCFIYSNIADEMGGGLFRCDGKIFNCLIVNNSATIQHGAIYYCYGEITNCTIAYNTGGSSAMSNCYGTISNCIIWNNADIDLDSWASSPTYSCCTTLESGEGNISSDPCFVTGPEGDYYLSQTAAGQAVDSPCVNAGSTYPGYLDLDIKSTRTDQVHDTGIVDIGFHYEFPLTDAFIRTIPPNLLFISNPVGIDPPDQILEIQNVGPGTLNWTLTESCPWLTVSSSSGSSSGEINSITLSVDTTGLTEGAYTCDLTISDPYAMNNPQVIPVKLVVYDTHLYVPSMFSTIQAAIDIAANGDTIVVDPGTYNENIYFLGKDITLTSTDPDNLSIVNTTIIKSPGTNSVVTFAGTETAACHLSGFTITGGNQKSGGGIFGGIDDVYAEATISNCIIKENYAESYGGGIAYFHGNIMSCIIANNSSNYRGGGMCYCDGSLDSCIIINNSSNGGGGGAICRFDGTIKNCLIAENSTTGETGGLLNCDGDITNCTVADNTGNTSGGMHSCNGVITNCIVWNNWPSDLSSSSTPTYSCWPEGTSGTGNINSDPCFISGPASNYYLSQIAAGQSADSPCVDAGSDTAANLGLDALTTRTDQVADSDLVDMGFHPNPDTELSIIIAVQPHELTFLCAPGTNPENMILEISNTGIGSVVHWTLTESCPWLSANPCSGSSTGEADTVTISVDTSGLTEGKYTCNLTISDPLASNNPQIIPVTLLISDGPFLLVPQHYDTIQSAIDAAIDGYSVVISPGTYTGDGNRDLDFLGKAITVRSTAPENPDIVAATIIDCQGSGDHRGFFFHNAEGSDSIIDGLTIQNGSDDFSAGGILIASNCSPSINNCRIINNSAGSGNVGSPGLGGGIYSGSALTVTLTNCIISNNEAYGGPWGELPFAEEPGPAYGGGIYARNIELINCIVTNNSLNVDSGAEADGCGVYCDYGSFINCTISGNYFDSGGGSGGVYVSNSATLENCILWGNDYVDLSGNVSASYCCIEQIVSGTGNIHTDPCFVTGPNGDYYLSHIAAGQAVDSPCIDTGSDTAANLGLDMSTTRTDGGFDSGIVDRGFHYTTANNTTLISAFPTSLDFIAALGGDNPTEKTVVISNAGTNTLNWTLTESCPWLSADPCSGSSTGEADTVTVSIDITGLAAGDYNDSITISDPYAANNPVTIPVHLSIGTPVISVTPSSLSYDDLTVGASPQDRTINISNSGGGILNWTINETCTWLSVDPCSGSSTGEADTVTISVDITGLTIGDYNCNITISDPYASNDPKIVPVDLHITYAPKYVPSQYSTIQSAINAAATSGDVIIVAPGTYNEDIHFGGKDIVLTSTDPDTGSIVESTIIQGTGSGPVVTFAGTETAACCLAGFTITGGHASSGGGIYGHGTVGYTSATISKCVIENNYGSSNGGIGACYGLIEFCTIRNNHSGYWGGGLGGCHGVIESCSIHGNEADDDGGGLENCNGEINNCSIYDNTSGDCGGGLYLCDAKINNCSIYSNIAVDDGGGLSSCDGTIINCLVINNSSSDQSAGLYNCDGSIINCTIIDNIGNAGSHALSFCNGSITNCIIWNNSPYDWDTSSSLPTYSCWPEGTTGLGNINADPCFVTGPDGDYYLSHIAAGQSTQSPCIDTGSDSVANLGLDVRTTRTDGLPDTGTVDMGFHYEIQYTSDDADINGDNNIDLEDFAIMADQWLDTPGTPSADIAPPGGDNIVDILDLNILTYYWLQ